jgi:uncharacterized membrane protein
VATRAAPRTTPPRWLVRGVEAVADHWLALFNAGMAIFATLPFVAPVLLATGHERAANALYALFSLTCHQMPSRAWHIMGHQVAYCERNTAIYFAMVLGGIVFARRRSIRPLAVPLYLLLILPMAIDGITQLVGWRESTWLLRTITGTLFGLATIWLIFPLLDRNMAELKAEMPRADR